MGFLSDLFGGPDKPKASAAEKASAEIGAREWNRRLDFLPIEDAYRRGTRARSSDRHALSHQLEGSTARGQGRQAHQALSVAGPAGVLAADADASNRAASVGKGVVSLLPQQFEREMRGDMRVISTGRGLADGVYSSLNQMGQTATDQALSDMNNRMSRTYSLGSGLASLGGIVAQTQGWLPKPKE